MGTHGSLALALIYNSFCRRLPSLCSGSCSGYIGAMNDSTNDNDQTAPLTGSASHNDFKEIAHSGGKITFDIVSDASGRKSYQVTYSGSRPVPMRMFAIYATPDGEPVANIQLGGIGSPWNPPPDPSCRPVFISSDSEGLFGHQCPACGGYWRSDTARFCPYCRLEAESFLFLTPAHLSYVRHYVDTLHDGLEKVAQGQSSQVEIDLDAIVDMDAGLEKPDFYHPGTSQQTKFRCASCKTVTDIRGRFGFCSYCARRNNLADLRTQISMIRAELNSNRTPPADALRQIVSAFDACCRDIASQLSKLPMTARRRKEVLDLLFHRLDAAEVVERAFDIDLRKGMSADLPFIRMMLQRRHVFEHEGGVVTRRYIEESGDNSVPESTLIREDAQNVHRLAGCLTRMATNFENGFNEILPPADLKKTRS